MMEILDGQNRTDKESGPSRVISVAARLALFGDSSIVKSLVRHRIFLNERDEGRSYDTRSPC
jgi:hypothetical protein